MNNITEQEYRVTKSETEDNLTFTGRIASWSARHRWWVIAASALVLVLAMFVSSTVETNLVDDNAIVVGESGEAIRLLDERFDEGGAPIEQLVFSNPALDVDHPAYRSTVEQLIQELMALPEVTAVVNYYDTGDSRLVSADRHVQRAQVELADSDDGQIGAVLETIYAARTEANAGGFYIGMAGNLSVLKQKEDLADEDLGRVFIVTLVLALVIMLLVFRAVVAALIPLILAVGAIITAMGMAALVSQAYALGEGYEVLISMLGLAVGIDYSLFIISRFRYERQAGREKLEAITVASNTTGRAVFYAGVTVMLSLAGLALTNNPVFISIGVGVNLVVFISIVGSLTFLPAVLSVLGDNVNRLRVPFLGRANGNGGLWSSITKKVLDRPLAFAAVTAAGLIALALPVSTIDLAFPTGSRGLHDAVDAKQAMVLLEEHFSGGIATPAMVVVDAPDVTAPEVQASVAGLIQRVGQDDAFVGPFETVVNRAGDLLFVRVALAGDREAAERGVELLRDEVVPDAFAGSGAEAYVTGMTAFSMDFSDSMYKSLPYVFGFVLGLAFLLLLVMFRSIVIPVKAILLNLLSVAAAYGVVVMVFQWGWGVGLLGSEAPGVIAPWLPLILFAILFGLSMDYHMLLLNRIKEAYDEGRGNDASVAEGIRLTAGQITSAAAIMVGVFGTFALMRDVEGQMFGLGLGVAVFIDATIIRSVLLPASMKLLGDRNWYLPSWLEWLPKVGTSESGRDHEFAPEAVPAMADD
ncbi:MAG: MMPL family transporter [Chloroflexi bacterium]|nr:MMPL family transporter [Chloroflexota bacterium]MCI0901660.1 MMPL family transporter [Chloroflexota bacterium]